MSFFGEYRLIDKLIRPCAISLIIFAASLLYLPSSYAQDNSPVGKLLSFSNEGGSGASAQGKLVVGGALTELERAGESGIGPWAFDDPAVRSVLRGAASGDQLLRDRIVAQYEARLLRLLSLNISDRLIDFYGSILELRPDPNLLNNRLRLDIALTATEDDVKSFGIARVTELQSLGALKPTDRLTLLLRGYYGSGWPIVIGLVFLIVLCSMFLFVAVSKMRHMEKKTAPSSPKKADKNSKTEKSEPEVELPTDPKERARMKLKLAMDAVHLAKHGVHGSNRGYSRTVNNDDEYSRLLSFFGLEDSASESEIKKAYRDMVKSYHPDANPGVDDVDSDLFVQEVKEIHDRIFEIRGSWFGAKR